MISHEVFSINLYELLYNIVAFINSKLGSTDLFKHIELLSFFISHVYLGHDL